MTKKRIAILGGGMAGLTTAYNLTKTTALREQYEVTIYQMGWRLGGKAASGRDAGGRNLEHGLHVWFGYYECAFRLLQEVYAARAPTPGSPLQTWTDAFKPQKHTGVGIEVGGQWSHVSIDWPEKSGFPGDGQPVMPLSGALTLLLGWVRDMFFDVVADWRDELTEQAPAPSDALRFLKATRAGLEPHSIFQEIAEQLAARARLTALEALEASFLWFMSLGRDLTIFGRSHLDGIVFLLWQIDRLYRAGPYKDSVDPKVVMIGHVLNVFAATMAGAVEDLIVPNASFETIDDEDFGDWLLRHGADPTIVATSSLVRLLYDISFQYPDGDPDRTRTCAAGSGLGSVVRMLATYKGSMLYHVQAGFGDAVIAPIYEVLQAQGVKFAFFRKVKALELSDDGQRVERVRLDRQADILAEPYRPTMMVSGMRCWPTQPFWDQIADGARLEQNEVNFESHWNPEPPVGEEVLTHGQDYDQVVLAIAMGGYKPLGDDPGLCAELVARGGAFADFVRNTDIVPTLALQIWSDRSLEQLGWMTGKSATVSGPQPFDIWAEMSQVLPAEAWPMGARPKTLHYFCGSYPTQLYKAAATQANVPALAAAEIRGLALNWLKTRADAWWPTACQGGAFDWSALHDPSGAVGEARLDAQFLRANIDPTECCVASAAGQTRYRLYPDQSGFSNLILTGEGCRHGLNATAVEAAVMSGMAASRAICGMPHYIPGYDFLTRKPAPEN
jgi:uncharacterized protein with NAD-binding domain and iron-sulfur cluster